MDVCSVKAIDQEKVDALKKRIIKEETNQRMAAIFSAMADPGRLKILTFLAQEELCVCEIVELVQQSQSSVSHQLRVLRNLNLVRNRREGKMVFYSLDDDHVKRLVSICQDHVEEK